MHITFVEIDPKTKRAFCSLQVTQFFSTQEVQASVCKLQIGIFEAHSQYLEIFHPILKSNFKIFCSIFSIFFSRYDAG